MVLFVTLRSPCKLRRLWKTDQCLIGCYPSNSPSHYHHSIQLANRLAVLAPWRASPPTSANHLPLSYSSLIALLLLFSGRCYCRVEHRWVSFSFYEIVRMNNEWNLITPYCCRVVGLLSVYDVCRTKTKVAMITDHLWRKNKASCFLPQFQSKSFLSRIVFIVRRTAPLGNRDVANLKWCVCGIWVVAVFSVLVDLFRIGLLYCSIIKHVYTAWRFVRIKG